MFKGFTVHVTEPFCACKARKYNFKINVSIKTDSWSIKLYCLECNAELITPLPKGGIPYEFEFSCDRKPVKKSDAIEELVTILNT